MTLRDQPRDIWKNTQTPPTYSRERCSWYLSRVFAIPDQNNILCNLKLFRIFLLSFFALDQGQASIHHNRCFFVWLVKMSRCAQACDSSAVAHSRFPRLIDWTYTWRLTKAHECNWFLNEVDYLEWRPWKSLKPPRAEINFYKGFTILRSIFHARGRSAHSVD